MQARPPQPGQPQPYQQAPNGPQAHQPQGWGSPGPPPAPPGQQWPQPPAYHQQVQPQGWPPPGPPAAPGPQLPGSGQPEPRPGAATLFAVTLWRLGIGGLALYYAADGKEETMSSESLSYLSNVGLGIGFVALAAYPLVVLGRRHEPRSGWLRGALTVMMLVVGLVFVVGMGEDPDGPHAVTPALVLIDWLFVGRNQFRTRAWEPPTWTAFLLLYLAYHRSNDLRLYPEILGGDKIGTMVPIMLAGTIVMAYLLYGFALLRRAVTGAGKRDPQPTPTWAPPQPAYPPQPASPRY